MKSKVAHYRPMNQPTDILLFNDEQKLCALTPTAAKLKTGIDFDEWRKIGASLAKASRSLQWWIGDWLNYGVKEYGDKRALAIEHAAQFGVQADAIRYMMHVAEKVVTRVTSLSWSHHREVCGLSPREQKQWLTKAQDEQWSVSDLRQALRQDGQEIAPELADASGFNPLRFALDFNRWAKQQDIAKMPKPQREALKRELKPVVDMWEKL